MVSRTLRMRAVAAGLAMAAALVVCGAGAAVYAQAASSDMVTLVLSGYQRETYAFSCLDAINELRAEEGLDELVMDEELVAVAQQRAAQASVYFDHVQPDGSDWDEGWQTSIGLDAENLAGGYVANGTLASSVVDYWTSDSLNDEADATSENLYSQEYRSVGIACFMNNGSYTWVAVFSADESTSVLSSDDAAAAASVSYDISYVASAGLVNPQLGSGQITVAQSSTNTPQLMNVNAVSAGGNTATFSKGGLDWESSDEGVATASDSGTITGVDAGVATVTARYEGIAVASAEVTCTVSIKNATFSEIEDQTYTGEAIEPSVTVTYNGETLIEGTDYTISYKFNTDVGTTAYAAVEGMGCFTGTKYVYFSIVEAADDSSSEGSGGTSSGDADGSSDADADGSSSGSTGGSSSGSTDDTSSGGTSDSSGESTGSSSTTASTATINVTVVEAYGKAFELLQAVNEQREEAGLDDLAMDASLLIEAARRAGECTVYYGAESPDGTSILGTSSDDGLTIAAQCLDAGSLSASAALENLLSTSQETLLSDSYASVGVACARTGSYTYFWVLLFSEDAAASTASEDDFGSLVETDLDIGIDLDAGFARLSIYPDVDVLAIGSSVLVSLRCTNLGYTNSSGSSVAWATVNDVSWASSKSSIASVSSSGGVKALKLGNATISANVGGEALATMELSCAYSLDSDEVSVTVGNQAYTGKAVKPNPKVTYNGTTLTKGKDYTLDYANNVSKGTAYVYITGEGDYTDTIAATFKIVAGKKISSAKLVSSTLSYTGSNLAPKVKYGSTTLKRGTDYTLSFSKSAHKAIGTYKVTITGKGVYTGSVTKTFKIVPKKVKLKSATKSSAKKKLTVKWSKVGGSVGKYQVRYRVKGTSKWKVKTVASSKASVVLSGLKSGKKYQVQVRAYKTVKGTKYCGAWSTAKTIQVK